MIETCPLAINTSNYCASAGVTYAFNTVNGLSFGELLIAVCLERATVLEAVSIEAMNQIESNSILLESYTTAAQMILANASPDTSFPLPIGYQSKSGQSQFTLAQFLTLEVGLSVPEGVWSWEQQMSLYGALKDLMEPLNTQSQEAFIDLQATLNARMQIMNLASSGTHSLNATALNTTTTYGAFHNVSA